MIFFIKVKIKVKYIDFIKNTVYCAKITFKTKIQKFSSNRNFLNEQSIS